MAQLSLFCEAVSEAVAKPGETGAIEHRAEHALDGFCSSEAISRDAVFSREEGGRDHMNVITTSAGTTSGEAAGLTRLQFDGIPERQLKRLLMVAHFRSPCCKAIHRYWPDDSKCRSCGKVVEFQAANQAAQTIVDWVTN